MLVAKWSDDGGKPFSLWADSLDASRFAPLHMELLRCAVPWIDSLDDRIHVEAKTTSLGWTLMATPPGDGTFPVWIDCWKHQVLVGFDHWHEHLIWIGERDEARAICEKALRQAEDALTGK